MHKLRFFENGDESGKMNTMEFGSEYQMNQWIANMGTTITVFDKAEIDSYEPTEDELFEFEGQQCAAINRSAGTGII